MACNALYSGSNKDAVSTSRWCHYDRGRSDEARRGQSV
jgi:hypothetical protein